MPWPWLFTPKVSNTPPSHEFIWSLDAWENGLLKIDRFLYVLKRWGMDFELVIRSCTCSMTSENRDMRHARVWCSRKKFILPAEIAERTSTRRDGLTGITRGNRAQEKQSSGEHWRWHWQFHTWPTITRNSPRNSPRTSGLARGSWAGPRTAYQWSSLRTRSGWATHEQTRSAYHTQGDHTNHTWDSIHTGVGFGRK